MSNIRIGLIGAGHIAKEHLKVINSIDNINVVGITSRTISKAQTLASSFNVDSVYNSIDELIIKSKPDALMVLVSVEELYDVVNKLIPEKIPLFIEKPPGLTPEKTKKLLEEVEKYGIKTMVGYNRRYYSIFHKGIEIISKHGNLLGVNIEGHERFWKISKRDLSDTILQNWIYANSTHTIDLLRFFGGEINKISSFNNSLVGKTADQFVASMEFKSGVIGTYTSHWHSPGGWSVTLYGDGVTVKFDPLEKGRWIDKEFNQNEISLDKNDIKFKPGFYNQMKAFIAMIKVNKLAWPGMDLLEALKTMELAEKLNE